MTGPDASTGEQVSWYLAQIKPNSFLIADRALRRQGFAVFCPMYEARQIRAGRSKPVKKPLFPGYLFVGFDPSVAPWRAINNTYGISRLVTFGTDYPPAIPYPLVVELMARCADDRELLPASSFAPGDLIRVNSGPFAQLVTKIESIGADQRIYMLLDILGRSMRIGVRVADVDKLESTGDTRQGRFLATGNKL